MKIKSLCLTFVQLFMFSSLGYSNENCQDGDFWQTWFKKASSLGLVEATSMIKETTMRESKIKVEKARKGAAS